MQCRTQWHQGRGEGEGRGSAGGKADGQVAAALRWFGKGSVDRAWASVLAGAVLSRGEEAGRLLLAALSAAPRGQHAQHVPTQAWKLPFATSLTRGVCCSPQQYPGIASDPRGIHEHGQAVAWDTQPPPPGFPATASL